MAAQADVSDCAVRVGDAALSSCSDRCARPEEPRITRRLCIGRSSARFGHISGGASERMPSDFFSTSRCSKSLAFSAQASVSASSSSKLRLACVRLLVPQSRVPRAPNDRAAADGSPARPPPWWHYVHSHATTPTPPACIHRCSSPCREPAFLTVSSCGSFRSLTLSPLSVKSMQPYLSLLSPVLGETDASAPVRAKEWGRVRVAPAHCAASMARTPHL